MDARNDSAASREGELAEGAVGRLLSCELSDINVRLDGDDPIYGLRLRPR